MKTDEMDIPAAPESKVESGKKGKFARLGKYSFAAWIAYQAVKGTLTTTFIWAPLIYMHFFK